MKKKIMCYMWLMLVGFICCKAQNNSSIQLQSCTVGIALQSNIDYSVDTAFVALELVASNYDQLDQVYVQYTDLETAQTILISSWKSTTKNQKKQFEDELGNVGQQMNNKLFMEVRSNYSIYLKKGTYSIYGIDKNKFKTNTVIIEK